MNDQTQVDYFLESLGLPLAEFSGSSEFFTLVTKRFLIMGTGLLCLAGLIVVFGLRGDANVKGIAVLLGLIGVFFLSQALHYRTKGQAHQHISIRVFARGLLYLNAKEEVFAPWANIAVTQIPTSDLSRGSTLIRYQNNFVYILHLKDGKKLTLDGSIKNVDDLGQIIQQKIAEYKSSTTASSN